MTDSYEPPKDSGPSGPGYPEWVAPAPPRANAGPGWDAPWPAGASEAGSPPQPGSPPEPPKTWGRATLAGALVAAMIVGAAAGVVSHWRWHGARPTLSAQSPLPVTSPFAPGGPVSPFAPSGPSGAQSAGPSQSGGGNAASGPDAAAAAKVEPGVVDIDTTLGFGNGAGAGTGMILTSSGEVLTNNHVIDGATSITVTRVDTGVKFKATVIGTDPTDDVALIQLQGASGLPTVPIGDSSAVSPGQSVIAIGNAGGVGGAPAVVTGTVQAVDQTITAGDFGGADSETLNGLIETNAPLQPGDSGGPLVNSAGQVIGIDTAASAGRRFRTGASVGFAIPIAHAMSVVRQIESGKATAQVHLGLPAFLGVSLDPAAARGGSGGNGATIAGVQAGFPAAGAGLTAGDTITSIDGKAVDSAQTLSTLTKSHRPGDRVTVGWTDPSGRRHSATITLASGPAD